MTDYMKNHLISESRKAPDDKFSALASLVGRTLREMTDPSEQNDKMGKITQILFAPYTPAPSTLTQIHRPFPTNFHQGMSA
jgi:hypothetical protein